MRLVSIAFAFASTALAQQQAPTPTPALSEAQIQAALTEQALLQRWNGMVAEWQVALGNLALHNVRTATDALFKVQDQIFRDERTIKDDMDRLRLEAKLRGQPEPHVASEDVYQWYREKGSKVALAAVDRVIKINNAYGIKKGGRK